MYADVAVDSPAPLKTYSFALPPGLSLSPGQAVWVPFGRSSRLTQGIVFGVRDQAPSLELKAVAGAIDRQPVLAPNACRLAEWLAEYYYAPLFECAAVMMPPGFRQRVRTYVEATSSEVVQRSTGALADRVLAHLKRHGGVVELGALRGRFGPNAEGAVERLVGRGEASRTSVLPRGGLGPKYVRRVRLTEGGRAVDPGGSEWRRRPKQAMVLARLQASGGEATVVALSETIGPSGAVVAALVARGLVSVEQERHTRDPLAGRIFLESPPPSMLTLHQETAFLQIRDAVLAGEFSSFLLHGVTGSGKTEVYLRALEVCVSQGRKGIVLVPELALEPQTVARFSARFPGRVAVLHSGVTPGEAYDEWWRVMDGEFDVVVGSRGAIFAPQPNLGLVVIDEEHEASYKQQDAAPRYDARRVAEERTRLEGAVLVSGSATPDLATYAGALSGTLRLLELPHRVQPSAMGSTDRGLATVQIVDLRQELHTGNRSIFSRALQEAVGQALREGSQGILFLNRRGTATFVQCRDCGAVIRCRRCETPLTYHGVEDRLMCHLCNGRRRAPARCPGCGGSRIRYLGIGTQRVEAEVATLFPSARVLRWDRDTARNRRAHEALLDRFARHDADLLVGTQMIAKGLDLPQVTVVGIVNADLSLYLPDFRAAERTFQLLTQVAGRAGRGGRPGRVVIQTYTPDHYAIQAAAGQDYGAFTTQEMVFRHRYSYPPAQPLVRLVYGDLDPSKAQRDASACYRALATERARAGMDDVQVVGPLPGYFRRVNGRYRWQVLLKGGGARELLRRCPVPRGWVVDVDPLHIL